MNPVGEISALPYKVRQFKKLGLAAICLALLEALWLYIMWILPYVNIFFYFNDQNQRLIFCAISFALISTIVFFSIRGNFLRNRIDHSGINVIPLILCTVALIISAYPLTSAIEAYYESIHTFHTTVLSNSKNEIRKYSPGEEVVISWKQQTPTFLNTENLSIYYKSPTIWSDVMNWTLIAENIDEKTGTYTWKVEELPTDSYYIKVEAPNYPRLDEEIGFGMLYIINNSPKDWNVYENADEGWHISYPSDWIVSTYDFLVPFKTSEAGYRTSLTGPVKSEIIFCPKELQEMSGDKMKCNNRRGETNFAPNSPVFMFKCTKEGSMLDTCDDLYLRQFLVHDLGQHPSGDYSYKLIFQDRAGDPWNFKQSYEWQLIANQMVKTFKFK